ncbi:MULTISPECIES: NmrA/HSCARG family protein [unclassified Caballeronia]|uniref:NmrA/HSCARG family protein n=1 Tax=unclassified Caballeronia TaxID=2646786 RepID=UPI002854F589|nr:MULTISPECIES: NmrA/HSCARG family protein [unclassified Caballeronia]MDR5753790.1 NmrA/HSCARG family protein [Caballeronia sp. LZ024]MDR5840169.1 NmrA/HSCARG family protein [Caballeronia sp. LZ031]
MTILVTGSTGSIGTQVLDHLSGKAQIRALTRSPERAHFPAGVTAVQGDLSDVDALRQAMRGVSTLFLLAPNAADELTQALQALNVARDEGVKGIVYLSVFKGAEYADVPHFTSKYTAERMIEQCDLPATILRPAYFIQNDVRQKQALLGQGVYAMPIGDKGISMVDVRDIGDAAARELLRREDAAGPLPIEHYELVGPDALDATSMSAIWSDVLKRPIRYAGDDLDALENGLKHAAPGWLAYDMRLMMRRYQQDGAVAKAADVERLTALLGRPLRSYREFAASMAAEWANQPAS